VLNPAAPIAYGAPDKPGAGSVGATP